MQILVMGGTRFVGKPLVARLMAQGHALTLFTRGKNPVPTGVEHITGDRSSDEGLSALQGRAFDVIVDSSGRTLDDSRRVLAATGHHCARPASTVPFHAPAAPHTFFPVATAPRRFSGLFSGLFRLFSGLFFWLFLHF